MWQKNAEDLASSIFPTADWPTYEGRWPALGGPQLFCHEHWCSLVLPLSVSIALFQTSNNIILLDGMAGE